MCPRACVRVLSGVRCFLSWLWPFLLLPPSVGRGVPSSIGEFFCVCVLFLALSLSFCVYFFFVACRWARVGGFCVYFCALRRLLCASKQPVVRERAVGPECRYSVSTRSVVGSHSEWWLYVCVRARVCIGSSRSFCEWWWWCTCVQMTRKRECGCSCSSVSVCPRIRLVVFSRVLAFSGVA